MGSLEREPRIPRESQPGYLEGYLDAIEKVRDVHERRGELSVEDVCMILRVSIKTLLRSEEVVVLPENLSSYPSLVRLLRERTTS